MKKNPESLSSITLGIAIPLALQNLVAFAVNLADTVMLGRLGDVAVSASAQANQIFFIVSLAVAGIADAANVMVSQAWGAKDSSKINYILAYTYRLAMGFTLILSVLSFFFPRTIMAIYTPEADVIAAGTGYLRIVAVSYIFYTITTVSTGVLRAVRNVKIAMAGSMVAMGVNVVLNYILIFGKFGFPELGIVGAAIATLIARIVESVVVVIYCYTKEKDLKIRVRNLIPTDKTLLKPFFRVSAPIIINELFWAIGESVVAIILGRMGKEVVSANSVCGTMFQMASIFIRGITAATCVVTGNTIGAGEIDRIPVIKRYFQRLIIIFGCFTGILIFALRVPVIHMFGDLSEVAKDYAMQIAVVIAIIQPFSAFQITNMTGLLRGGGDVRFAMYNDLIFLWCVTIPLGFIGGIWLKLPVWAVFAMLRFEKIGKSVVSEIRLHSKHWIHHVNEVNDKEEVVSE